MVKVQILSLEAFEKFGRFKNMVTPPAGQNVFGADTPTRFFPDMIKLDTGGDLASFSICQVDTRPAVIDVSEIHRDTEELIMPLDGDIDIHVGPPTPDGKPPLDRIEVFRVPKGTAVVLDRGVWHHAPFAVDTKMVNTLIVLAPLTYANDCTVVDLEKEQQIGITAA